MIEYITIDQLHNDIRNNIHKIPKDIFGVVGIPRSGMIPASIISEYLNVGLCSIDTFLSCDIDKAFKSHGNRMLRTKINNSTKKILIVDDTCYNGKSLFEAKKAINTKYTNEYTFVFLSVYLEGECGLDKPDIYLTDVRENAKKSKNSIVVYEWNIFAHGDLTEKTIFDLDGVMCVDPPDEKNINEYYSYICNPIPLFIPTSNKINILTYRLNKYRNETENFLKNNGINDFNLYMFNSNSYEEREKTPSWLYKGLFYKQNDFELFVESDDYQAKKINIISRKPVYCVKNNRMYNYENNNFLSQILCKSNDNLYYMKFVKPGQTFKSLSNFDLNNKNVIDLSWLNVDFYEGYDCNEHHITTESYYNVILPFLKLYIKDFNFDLNDFEIVKHIAFFKKSQYDVSYLVPKNNYMFSMNKNSVQIFNNCNFEYLHYFSGKFNDELQDDVTEYHKVFRGFHSCCKIINETINNNLKIFVSGDSMSIPLIPILCCYFKEVVFMDNRDGISHCEYYENVVFDYVIIQLWEGHPIEKPLGINLI